MISSLISLIHNQCLKLSKHWVSTCFLGSRQPDSFVEQKAMRGMYDAIYVCLETVLRLIKLVLRLAKSYAIALFVIDGVHCVSKWGAMIFGRIISEIVYVAKELQCLQFTIFKI